LISLIFIVLKWYFVYKSYEEAYLINNKGKYSLYEKYSFGITGAYNITIGMLNFVFGILMVYSLKRYYKSFYDEYMYRILIASFLLSLPILLSGTMKFIKYVVV